jgi:hypothetical protein
MTPEFTLQPTTDRKLVATNKVELAAYLICIKGLKLIPDNANSKLFRFESEVSLSALEQEFISSQFMPYNKTVESLLKSRK